MSKIADRYLKTDPWQVIEEGFDPARSLVSESIFSLANEYMGVRGFVEEGLAPGIPGMVGSYLGGVYELAGEEGPGGYKGIVKQTHYMVNAANFLKVRLEVNGQPVVLSSEARDFVRRLDMRTGLLSRSYSLKAVGIRLHLRFERILSMQQPSLAAQQVAITADAPCRLRVQFLVDGSQQHYATGTCLWQQVDAQAVGDSGSLLMKTATTGLYARYRCRVAGSTAQVQDRVLCQTMEASLQPGQPLCLEKQIQVDVFRTGEAPAEKPLQLQAFQQILAGNTEYFATFWRTGDVEVLGDELTQQGIRYCIFQLHQTFRGLDGRNNIGAKGLTGEAYNGHAFWDTETYCLPYYLLNDHQAARSLMMYRHFTLKEAMERAKQLDCAGACYPIATLNGKEACTLWQHASLQMQPSTAVAYGIWHYVHVTGDRDFLYREGIAMLVEICRYLATRGNWNQDRTGYGYYGVMGPDEFHLMVNNNFYTNFMAQQTLLFTLNTLQEMPVSPVTREEMDQWRQMAENMILPQREDLVIEQHEGYFNLPHLDVRGIPVTDFPLYENWSYDRIYRTDMIKQPDVLMAMFLHPACFSKEELAANYDYYEPRCIHESSLSPSVHSILAASLGRHQEAERFFGFAARLDLDNYNRNTGEGLHLTSIAAAWVTIVYGFGGLRTDGAGLALSPFLPSSWAGYSFCLKVQDSWVKVRVDGAGTRLSLMEGAPVRLNVHGQEVLVS